MTMYDDRLEWINGFERVDDMEADLSLHEEEAQLW
jgi:hypothetical protein